MSWTSRILVVEAAAIAGTLALSLDVYAHKRVEDLGGVNIWGYRGPVAHQRQLNEIRVAVVGGTRAFGWGEPASALVSEVRRLIMLTTDQPGAELRPVVAINLGRLGALADSYPAAIEHFSYLQPDYICLYDDLGVRGGSSTQDTSGVFALTGYAPVLPLVLREKGMIWRLGDVQRGYASAESQRDPGTSTLWRAAGSTLEAVGDTLGAADRAVLAMLPRNRVVRLKADTTTEPRTVRGVRLQPDSTAEYADAMIAAIDTAHRHARGVVVVVSPSETAEQAGNLRALKIRLDGMLGSTAWLRLVDLGEEPALSADHALRLDGWNYASAGLARVANRIAPALLSLIAQS